MTIGTIARQETNRLIEMCEDGTLNPTAVVIMLAKYMSEDDVADCMDCNELSARFQEDDEYDDSMDGDHDSAMASAGFGTDEDYGYYGEDA